MKINSFLLSVAVLASTVYAADEVRLPGEDGTKPALSPAPFPDRMSAYVWRNWGLVEKNLLAETVGATADDITSVAVQMGLEPDPVVLPEWKTKGYITIVRRNWHLLPYDQLMKLIGKTRKELYFCLMEDDFLWVKLGGVKPKCEELKWRGGEVEKWRSARQKIAEALKGEGIDPAAPEEPRFSFVREIAAVSPSEPAAAAADQSPFGFRLIFSYFADYGDPLGDPAVSSYPDGLLQKLSANGVNAVWLHTVLRTLAKDPKYPEFGEGSELRIANLKTLVARAAKYGIKVFLYMNEPRAMPREFYEVNEERKGFMGVDSGVQYAMCTSSPEVRRWVRDSLRQVFSQVPGLGGIFTITMSENLTNCASRRKREMCPRCRNRKTGEIVAEINRAMIEGMAAGNPDAEALVWNWQWPKDEEAAIVAALPAKNCRLMAVSENAMKICRGGVEVVENDYSISIVGPGENARRLWGFAKDRGIPSVAKVQAGNSWELSAFPYIPVMDLVAQHAVNLANEGVDGVMLSWSLGCCPSPNLRVYRELRRGETDKEGVLDRMAAEMYGAGAKKARAAWTAFSNGFTNYPFSCSTIYVGPHHWGPANPLYMEKTGWKATMVGIPYDNLDGWRSNYPRETYAELIGKVADGFAEGCRLMEGVAGKRELDMFRAEQMHFASCRDQALFVIARDRGDRDSMRRLAKSELERAKAYWPIVRADSRIGYESSNHYFFIPRDLLEKILSCHDVMAGTTDVAACRGQLKMQNIAHRGMWDAEVPQNTVEAIKRAYDSGATWVETDFHHTKADQMVCIHVESELKSYTGCSKKIVDLTPEDIATLNLADGTAPGVKSPKARGASGKVYRIPLLDQVLAVVPKDCVLQAEIKGYSPQYADIFDRAVKAAGLTDRNIVVSSFQYDALKDFKARYPKYRTAWLVSISKKKPFDVQEAIAKCKEANIEVFCPGCRSTKGRMTREDADAVRASGLEFRMFGVNSLDDLRQAKALGATGFTCNYWRKAFDWADEIGGVTLLK